MFKNLSRQSKGWIYGLFSQATWGSGPIATKLIDNALPSSLLVTLRHGIGAITLGLLLLRSKGPILKGLPIFHLILLGIIAAGLPDLFLIEAIRRSGAIVATMLARIEVPLAVIFAHFLLKEKVNRGAYYAAIVSIAGVWFISYRPEQPITLNDNFYIGVLFALGTALLWALSGTYAKYILNKKTDPLALSFARMCVGSIFALAILLLFVQHPFASLQNLTIVDWSMIIYLGIFLSGLAYLAFYRSLTVLDAHVAVLLSGVQIIVLLLLGLAIGETVSLLQWFGIGLIAFSILLIKRSQKDAELPENAN